MSRYVVFVTEDEEAWEARSEAGRQEVYDADARFVRLLERRGGKVVGGAELGPSRSWVTLEPRAGITRRTDGPYAESVEQLGGFSSSSATTWRCCSRRAVRCSRRTSASRWRPSRTDPPRTHRLSDPGWSNLHDVVDREHPRASSRRSVPMTDSNQEGPP